MIETALIDYLTPKLTGVALALDHATNAQTPLIELATLSDPRTKNTCKTSEHRRTEIECECWEKNALNAKLLANTLISELTDFRGLIGEYFVFGITIYNEFSGYSPTDKLYYRNLTINLSYKRG